MNRERVIFLDWLRVTACFLVIVTHCNEPVYLGGEGTFIASSGDAFWSTFFVSLCRCCVPLFVLASSYLLFPVTVPTVPFYRRRIARVGIPALVWLCLYSIFGGGDMKENFIQLIFNFSGPAGHLWFCYMIPGLYFIMPLLSPWAEKAGKRELSIILLIWLFTTFIPAIRQARMAIDGHWNVWGEANWTEYGMFYYASGFIGYLLIGLYFRKFAPELNWRKTLLISVPLFCAGFAIAAAWFRWYMPGDFPVNGPLSIAVNMETMLRNCTPSVLMMTVGVFMVFRKIKSDGAFYRHVILNISQASYGIYLMHIFALLPLYSFWRGVFGGYGADGGCLSGSFWATPAVVICSAVSTFIVCAAVSSLLRKIPAAGKYIVG